MVKSDKLLKLIFQGRVTLCVVKCDKKEGKKARLYLFHYQVLAIFFEVIILSYYKTDEDKLPLF